MQRDQIYKTKVSINKLYAYLENKENNAYVDNLNVQADNDDDLDGLDNLFNYNDYYKPIKARSAFSDKYKLYVSNGDDNSSINEYFDKIKPHLHNLIDYHKEQGEWKMQLSMSVTFVSHINDKNRIMHSKSDNVTIMPGYETSDIIDLLFNSFKERYQGVLETRMVGSSYTFDNINHLDYHLNKIILNRGSTYAKKPKWIASKKCTINPENKNDNACFAYSIMVALNHRNIANNPQKINNVMPFC